MQLFRFEPIFRRYLWGGRRLATVLGKPIGAEGDCAESWEIVDRSDAQSVVAGGPLAGQTLRDLLLAEGRRILGERTWQAVCDEHRPPQLRGRFPLLLKFLDANRTLSVQVHPDDAQAAALTPPDLGKTEAWYVIDAQPDSVIYAGLKSGVDRAALAEAVKQQRTAELLHQIHPQRGDCIFVPPGTVHAIGSGLLIAEIQQSSDTTYRLFDWKRVGRDGKPRDLHVDEALRVTNFARGPLSIQSAAATARHGVVQLVSCSKFVMNHWSLGSIQPLNLDDQFRLLCAVEGSLRVMGETDCQVLAKGQSMLIPASMQQVSLEPLSLEPLEATEFLEISAGRA